MKAILRNYRQSPRKVRLVSKSVEGKKTVEALTILSFMPKRATGPLKDLLMSAIANAKAQNIDTDNLVVSSIRVDKGLVMKRMMPRARGSAYRINKRTSHVILTLGEKKAKKSKVANKEIADEKVKAPKKTTKSTVTKVKKTTKTK